MPDQSVFISWSGGPSHEVASALRTFLGKTLAQKVSAFVSSEDIDRGARGLAVIARELEQAMFGVVVVTHGNVNSVWVNFEAGALSKSMDDDNEDAVAPLLVGITDAEITGPLKQFQNTDAGDVVAVRSLVGSINKRLVEPLDEGTVDTLFKANWPDLEVVIAAAAVATPAQPGMQRSSEDLLDEVLTSVRGLQRTVDRIAVDNLSGVATRDLWPHSLVEDQLRLALRDEGIEIMHFSFDAARNLTRVRLPQIDDLSNPLLRSLSVLARHSKVDIHVYLTAHLLRFVGDNVTRIERARETDDTVTESDAGFSTYTPPDQTASVRHG